MKSGIKLDANQKKAVKFGNGPLLIIAGAGTGKTSVITERIKYLVIKKGVNPSKILALTFTEKAAFEMEERIDKTMPYGYTQMWISTFHSFCDRILRSESIHIGLNPAYKLLTQAESILFFKKNLFTFKFNYFRPLGNPDKFLEAILSHFSRLKDEDISPDEYLNWIKSKNSKIKDKEEFKKYLELANAYTTYEQLKSKEGVMDFSDLISNTLKLFRERKNILKQYQEKFEYILVDEFQDTNFGQNELAIMLSEKKQNINVVGDDDQSIYRFRGSSISNILQFKKRFPKVKIITLTNNYRSTKEILDKSYELIQFNNPDRLEAKEKINKKLVSVRNIQGESINLIYKQRAEDEADAVAKEIIKIMEQKKSYEYKDFAILIRANSHAEPFIRSLERLQIPYQFLGPGRLFHQEEIKDLIAYLKVLYNFEDSQSLYRVLNIPIFGFDTLDIASVLNFAKRNNYSLFKALENIDKIIINKSSKDEFIKLTKIIKKHIKLIPKLSAGQILYFFLEDSGMINKIIEYKTLKEELIAKNIAKFFDKLKTYETEHITANVFDVVDWIDLSMQMGESPLATELDWSENNAVNILTVHSSKGLEFPVVFLVNLVSQRFPTRERQEKIPIPDELIKEILPTGDFHLEEERRLFYVGMTRARDILVLSAANYYGEGKQNKKVSPFVFESLGIKTVENTIALNKHKDENSQLSLLEWSQKNVKDNPLDKNKLTSPINYISYSQIQTFDTCPLHYKLRYILKIPTTPTPAQSFGISIHLILRDFYQNWINGEKINIKNVRKLFKADWISEGYHSRAHELKALKSAQKILDIYLKNNFNKDNLPLSLELPFMFNIKGIKVGGRIDRIDSLGKDKISIIDYKTGNKLPNPKQLAEDMQLSFYALAATEVNEKPLGLDVENVNLSLHFLNDNQILAATRTKEQLTKTKKFILEKVEEISKSDFSCNKSLNCKNCEYKMLCRT
jgi:DNA helicase II / ATP-dependent DNA helicase PcrA